MITSANTDDREPVAELLGELPIWSLFADKGYIGVEFAETLFDEKKVHIFTPSRSNSKQTKMPVYLSQFVFKHRRRVETVFSQMSDQLNLQRVRAKSLWGLITRLNLKFLAFVLAVLLK